ncbi:hypothetical protein [Thalassoporum mexicanum]|nr:hypothetical protein [Pseudanabaena sp. PCC 7367]
MTNTECELLLSEAFSKFMGRGKEISKDNNGLIPIEEVFKDLHEFVKSILRIFLLKEFLSEKQVFVLYIFRLALYRNEFVGLSALPLFLYGIEARLNELKIQAQLLPFVIDCFFKLIYLDSFFASKQRRLLASCKELIGKFAGHKSFGKSLPVNESKLSENMLRKQAMVIVWFSNHLRVMAPEEWSSTQTQSEMFDIEEKMYKNAERHPSYIVSSTLILDLLSIAFKVLAKRVVTAKRIL